MNKYEIKHSKYFRNLANRVIRETPELSYISEAKPKIAYVTSQQEKTQNSGTRNVLAECKKVPDAMQWCCPYDFVITVYVQNCAELTDKENYILMLHELLHIGIKQDGVDEDVFYCRGHDYEEFKMIIEKYGLDWSDG